MLYIYKALDTAGHVLALDVRARCITVDQSAAVNGGSTHSVFCSGQEMASTMRLMKSASNIGSLSGQRMKLSVNNTARR